MTLARTDSGKAREQLAWVDSHRAPPAVGAVRYAGPVASSAHLRSPARLEPAPLLPQSSCTKNVLIIASRFPPVASVGTIRVRKLVKYLSDLGWWPVVITGAMRSQTDGATDVQTTTDHESLADLPKEASVYRLNAALDDWPNHLTCFLAKHLEKLTHPVGLDSRRWAGFLKWRFQRLHDRFAFPDRGVFRLPSAVKLALSLHRRYRFDAIFSSGMPFSDHVIGLALQSILRKPWLADFRDPWVEYIHWQQWQTDWGERLTRATEAAVVRRASFVIGVNNHMAQRFVSRYTHEPTRKFVTIENGFDPSDFLVNESRARPRKHFRLLYAGSLYGERSPRALLGAFCRFLQEVPGSQRHAQFDFAGRPGPFLEELGGNSKNGNVHYLGMLPHAAAARSMASADVNVVILPNVPGGENDTTAKVYECLGSGQAVLAAVPLAGAAAEVLRGFDGVWLCDPDDMAGLSEAIKEMYRRWLSGALQPRRSPERLRAFTRKHQAERLVACLDSVVPRRGPSQGAGR